MEEIKLENLPRHVAIIMDGNGRWAKRLGMKRVEGHKVGVESVREIVRFCRKIGIGYLTLYAFSHENWLRPRMEIDALMQLLNHFLKAELKEMLDNDIRFNTLGDLDRLPHKTKKLLEDAKARTKSKKGMVLSLALSYGGRPEIARACRAVARECMAGRLGPDDVDEDCIAARLYTADMPDPDLLIRTGGEYRISNFLLWQIAYSELYVTSTYWPEFREDALKEALLDYQGRQRRFGRTGDQVEDTGKNGVGK